ncbi:MULTISPECIES: alpha/beta hydrolase [Kocuria]|uniref:Dienelactone hydrolase family protein n=1 Tax=Kocuria gwangalliensis TaxID=501592 RepID=A0ABP8WXL5_9MICC|nr:PHB depolymerase family esterase [Kocuria sp.]MDO5366995.1 PHB depolymerase family esterase [Kocuria sp.]
MSDTPFVIWNNEPADRTDTPLVVMFHGYGSHEEDLLAMIPALLPTATYASLRAPQQAGMGYQWFPLSGDLSFSSDAVIAAVEPVSAWIQDQAQHHSKVFLLGFSQGMAVATSVARHIPETVDAVVGLSGFAVPIADDDAHADFFNDAYLREHPLPMFWGRDPEDPVIPQAMVDATADWAVDHAEVTKVQYRGIGHGVSPQELGHIKEYLQHVVS